MRVVKKDVIDTPISSEKNPFNDAFRSYIKDDKEDIPQNDSAATNQSHPELGFCLSHACSGLAQSLLCLPYKGEHGGMPDQDQGILVTT